MRLTILLAVLLLLATVSNQANHDGGRGTVYVDGVSSATGFRVRCMVVVVAIVAFVSVVPTIGAMCELELVFLVGADVVWESRTKVWARLVPAAITIVADAAAVVIVVVVVVVVDVATVVVLVSVAVVVAVGVVVVMAATGVVCTLSTVIVGVVLVVATVVVAPFVAQCCHAICHLLMHLGVMLLHLLHCGVLLPNVLHYVHDLLFGNDEFGVAVVGKLALSCVGAVHVCANPAGDLCGLLLDATLCGPLVTRLRQGCVFCCR